MTQSPVRDTRRVIVALDGLDETKCIELCRKMDPRYCRVKVGKELFTRAGPQVLDRIHALEHEIFLDLKFHDIPATVAGACRAAAAQGVWMMNVHAAGGVAMMRAAMDALGLDSDTRPLLIAVTVLTSLDDASLQQLGIPASAEQQVARLAGLTAEAGLDGVVCSALEAGLLREQFSDLLTVTPGIRLADDGHADQRRVTTPQQALQNGAGYLVIGRSITAAADPLRALEKINQQIASHVPS